MTPRITLAKGYKEEVSSFQKIGNYLSSLEYKFQSKRVAACIPTSQKRCKDRRDSCTL